MKYRIDALKEVHSQNGYTWVSMEPFPPPEMFKQSVKDLVDKLQFVDFIIYGKLNYDPLGKNKEFYKESVNEFRDRCEHHGIRYVVKKETLDLIK